MNMLFVKKMFTAWVGVAYLIVFLPLPVFGLAGFFFSILFHTANTDVSENPKLMLPMWAGFLFLTMISLILVDPIRNYFKKLRSSIELQEKITI